MQDNTARNDERGGNANGIRLVYSRGRRLDGGAAEAGSRWSGVPRPMLVAGAVVALAGTLWWVGHATLQALHVR